MTFFLRKIGKRRQMRSQKKKVRMQLKKKIMKMMNPTRKVEYTNSQKKKTDHTVIRFYRIKILIFVHI